MAPMTAPPTNVTLLMMEDAALVKQCEVDVFKASGPGGQHRNKVSTAIRLRHGPTGLDAIGQESRSQQDNRRAALRRLRMRIACEFRCDIDTAQPPPAVVAECLHTARGQASGTKRLSVGRRDRRFWPVAAWILDVLAARQGRLGEAGAIVGISTGQLSSFLRSERHLLAAATGIRRQHGHGSIR